MKRTLLTIATSVALASGALAASVSYTNSATAGGNGTYANIALNKFDTGLGTLTGVVVTVNFTTLAGSFSVTTSTETAADVETAEARVIVRQNPANALGFTQIGQTNFTVATTPSLTYSVPGNSSQSFAVTSTNVLSGSFQNINSGFWSAYQSAGGIGSVGFQVRNSALISASGGDFSQSVGAFTAQANMSVTYNYTPVGPSPIPEPATVMAGAFLTLVAAGACARRRKSRATPRS